MQRKVMRRQHRVALLVHRLQQAAQKLARSQERLASTINHSVDDYQSVADCGVVVDVNYEWTFGAPRCPACQAVNDRESAELRAMYPDEKGGGA